MYSLEIDEKLVEEFKKLAKKDKLQMGSIHKKVEQICQNPRHFERLEHLLLNMHRVHIDRSFVLIYSVDEKRKVVTLHTYDHHDNIYKHPHVHNQGG